MYLPFDDGRMVGDVVDMLAQVYDQAKLKLSTPLALVLDECCSDLASNGARNTGSRRSVKWIEFSLSLSLR